MALLTRDGHWRVANRALAALLGYAADEINGLSGDDLIHGEDRSLATDWLCQFVEDDRAAAGIDLRLLHRDGTPQWVVLEGRLLTEGGEPSVVVQIQDSAGRRSYIGAVEALARRYELILNSAGEGIIALDEDGTVAFANVAAAGLLHCPLEDMMGQSARVMLAEMFAETGTAAGRAALKARHGADIPVEYRLSPIIDDGRSDGMVIVFEDISERLLAERALEQSHASVRESNEKLAAMQMQLLQSEKMASIGQLAAGVAHEINNPIGFVLSNIGSLERYLGSIFSVLDVYMAAEPLLRTDAAVHAEIERVKQEAELDFLREDIKALMAECKEGIGRVRKIVQDLKDFARVDRVQEWERVDLHKGLDSTLNVVHNEIKYKADVVKDYGDLPEVECLPSQLNQVFLNLLVNAAHAVPDDRRGTITLCTDCDATHVWVEVADTGCGIKPSNMQRIFDPFFTTKPVGSGTGLGLSISYGIVKKHGGSIDVTSEPYKGATFRVRLPIRQAGFEAEKDSP